MHIKHLVVGFALALSLGACKKGGGASGDGDIAAFMKLDTEKAAAFRVGGENCAEKAKSVGAWRKANTTNYKALQKALGAKWGKEPPKDVMEKYGPQMQDNKKAVLDAMMACSNDEAFGKMMDETKDL